MAFALMYDSDNETYPDDVEYIAAYVDGSRTGRNYARAKAKHPRAKFLTISAVGDLDADVIDIEPGNVWPVGNAVPWIRRQLARGHLPAYYCNTSTRQECLDVFRAAGLPDLPWWRADYRAGEHAKYGYPPRSLPLGEAAWQFADPPITGSHWDVSVIGPALQAYLDGNAAGLAINTTPITSGADLGGGLTSEEDELNEDQAAKIDRIARFVDDQYTPGVPGARTPLQEIVARIDGNGPADPGSGVMPALRAILDLRDGTAIALAMNMLLGRTAVQGDPKALAEAFRAVVGSDLAAQVAPLLTVTTKEN